MRAGHGSEVDEEADGDVSAMRRCDSFLPRRADSLPVATVLGVGQPQQLVDEPDAALREGQRARVALGLQHRGGAFSRSPSSQPRSSMSAALLADSVAIGIPECVIVRARAA